VGRGIEFDWDGANIAHLAKHNVTPSEFEELLNNDPLDLYFEEIDNEERYRSIGVTDGGRLLSVVWTIRGDTIRAITAFHPGASDRKAYLGRPR